jgi:hypothetical protein
MHPQELTARRIRRRASIIEAYGWAAHLPLRLFIELARDIEAQYAANGFSDQERIRRLVQRLENKADVDAGRVSFAALARYQVWSRQHVERRSASTRLTSPRRHRRAPGRRRVSRRPGAARARSPGSRTSGADDPHEQHHRAELDLLDATVFTLGWVKA